MAFHSGVSAEDIENNLRLFALRKAASSSKEFTDVKNHIIIKVDSTADTDCPRHGQEKEHHHSYDMNSYGDYNHRDRGHNDQLQHISRKEMARELRLSAARQEREAKSRVMNLSSPVLENGRRGSSFSPGPNQNYHQYNDFQRSESVDPWPQYNSMPRRMSANPTSYGNKAKSVHRHGSFQEVNYGKQPPPKVDIFKGRVDFKSILRRFDPKDDERAFGGQKGRLLDGSISSSQKSKYMGGSQKDFSSLSNVPYDDPYHMPQRPPPPKRGTIVDSDFDFRGSAPALTRSMSPQQIVVRPLSPSVSTSSNSNMFPVHHTNRPLRPQKLDLEISSKKRQDPITVLTNDRPTSPNNFQYSTNTKSESNPVSPRRVEFSEQVFSFSFAGNEPSSSTFPPPPLMVSSPIGKKPILRQSNSDPHSNNNTLTKDKNKKALPHELPNKPSKGFSLIEQFERQEMERRIQQQLREDHERLMSSMNMVSPLTIEHTNLDEETTSGIGESGSDGSTVLNQRRKVSSDALVQIYIPPTKSNKDTERNQVYSQSEIYPNVGSTYNQQKLEKHSTDSDSDSNDISETSGATSTSANTTFDAEGGEDSDEGTLSARTESFEDLEKELDRSQGEEIVSGNKKESVINNETTKSGEDHENIVKTQTNSKSTDENINVTDNTTKKPTGLKAMRTVSAEVKHTNIAPMLADWNRSQSFPIPGKSCMQNVIGIGGNYLRDENGFAPDQSQDETGIFKEGLPRKRSLPLTASNTSVNQDGKLSSVSLNSISNIL